MNNNIEPFNLSQPGCWAPSENAGRHLKARNTENCGICAEELEYFNTGKELIEDLNVSLLSPQEAIICTHSARHLHGAPIIPINYPYYK